MYRLISLLSGRTLKAAFVSEGYFHEDVQSPRVHSSPPLRLFFPFLSLRCSEHTPSLRSTVGVLFDLLIILFRHDCAAGRERESVYICASPCSVYRCVHVGNTDDLSCCKKVKEKKKCKSQNSQRECWVRERL